MANVETKSDFPASESDHQNSIQLIFFNFFRENIGNGWTDVINIAET